MGKKTLSPSNFGDRIYERFPSIYQRQDEEFAKKSLYRYLSAVADGGMQPVISDINKLLTFYDAEKLDISIAPYIFRSFGFDVFNGIPENYVRNLLPIIGDLFERKGSVEVVEYLTTVVANVKSRIEVITKGDSSVDARFGRALFGKAIFNREGKGKGVIVTLELDYGIGDMDLPDEAQIKRIIREFLPFYCFVTVIYSFIFIDEQGLKARDALYFDNIREKKEDSGILLVQDSLLDSMEQHYLDRIFIASGSKKESSALFGNALFGKALFGCVGVNDNPDEYRDLIRHSGREKLNLEVRDIDKHDVFVLNNDVGSISFLETGECVKIETGIERVSIAKESYLPRGSALLGTGQPMGSMILGVNRRYTVVEYAVDKVKHLDSGEEEVIIIG